MSRTKNALRNTAVGLFSKIITLGLSFASRTVFIYVLGTTLLGVNSLYTEILSMLSFAELGFGNALRFAMYKPIADQDDSKITQILAFYKKVYLYIVTVIIAIGLALIPFLPRIVKGADMLTVGQLKGYYILFLFNTSVSYFLAHKLSYVSARQESYVYTKYELATNIITNLLQILVVVVWKNFLLYLLIRSACLLLSKVMISKLLDRRYPVLTKKPEEPLPVAEKKSIFKEVKGLAVHQFSSVAVHSTDNIIISSLSGLGVTAVGLISNYNMLMNSVLSFVEIALGSVAAGFGDIVAHKDREGYHRAFLDMAFIDFWIYGFCSICFYILVPPFISLWIGADKLIDSISFFLIILNLFLQGQCTAFNYARIAVGNFGKDSGWALVQALVNLVVSALGAHYLGLVGVYVGTICSRMVYVIFRPYSTYEIMFQKSSMEYYCLLIKYGSVTFLVGLCMKLLSAAIMRELTWLSFVQCTVVLVLGINLIFFLLFFRSREWAALMSRIARLIGKRKRG